MHLCVLYLYCLTCIVCNDVSICQCLLIHFKVPWTVWDFRTSKIIIMYVNLLCEYDLKMKWGKKWNNGVLGHFLCTVKVESSRQQLRLMSWIYPETCLRAVPIARPSTMSPACYHWTTVAPWYNMRMMYNITLVLQYVHNLKTNP